MSAAANYLEEAILNHFLRNQAVSAPSAVYIALYLNSPTDADTGTEVSGGGYTRKQITFGAPAQSGDKAVVTNNAKVEFDIASTNWGAISHWAIRTAATGGNMIVHAPFTRVETVNSGNRFTIETGNIQVSAE